MIDGEYADGTPGWSGSSTSREASTHPRVAPTQDRVHNVVIDAAELGTTQSEASALLNLGHGTVSGALTRLHRAGKITRLTERRNKQQVYILPEHVNGRQKAPYRPQTGTKPVVSASEVEETVRCIDFIPGNAEPAIRFLLTNNGIRIDEDR